MAENMTDHERWIARTLFEIGAVRFGAFKLKLHEKNPDAPLSPIFFNLRTGDNPKPGPLGAEVVDAIGQELFMLAHRRELDYTLVAGIPNAGDPFADAFVRAGARQLPPPLRFGKKTEGDRREIFGLIRGRGVPGDVLLFVDDLVTKSDTKLEALEAAKREGLTVRDLVVLIDRVQGGAGELDALGYRLHAIFSVDRLLAFYVTERMIGAGIQDEVLRYLAANAQ